MGVCGASGQGEPSGVEAGGLEAGVKLAANASYIVSVICTGSGCREWKELTVHSLALGLADAFILADEEVELLIGVSDGTDLIFLVDVVPEL